ncbi:MAG: hypothetical protein NTU53_04220 [Planctomycetota bacterium]|nr:hypothetical protein [Planctomycetota bacterium]
MPLFSSQIARQEDGQVTVRAEPLRVKWSFDDLVSADGHGVRCVFSCSVRALPEAAERRMLAEVFLTQSPVLTTERLTRHFEAGLRTAAAGACQKQSAGQWVDCDRKELVEALKSAANRMAFSSGIELLPPFDVEIESPTLERQRLEQMHRALAEERTAGQVEHVQRSAELLKQFESIRQSGSQLSPGQILQQMSPADPGMLLQTLLLASAKEKGTEAVWVVAGPSLLRVDPRAEAVKAEVIGLPGGLGALRSVQVWTGGLLLGGRSGVMVVNPSSPGESRAYVDPAVTWQLGFSRAVVWHDEIWACHSEAGIVAWKLDEPREPLCALRPVDLGDAAARNLQVLDESRLVFSSGQRLMLLLRKNAEETPPVVLRPIEPGAGAEIIAVLPDQADVTVVLKDGRCQLRQGESLAVVREQRASGAVSAAALLPWLGSTRVLLATEDGPILCVGWDDELVTQYQSPYRGSRALAASRDVIAALSADRQRVILWRTWNGRQPFADLFIPSLARHRAADLDV